MKNFVGMIEVSKEDLANEMIGNDPTLVKETLMKLEPDEFLFEYMEITKNFLHFNFEDEKYYLEI